MISQSTVLGPAFDSLRGIAPETSAIAKTIVSFMTLATSAMPLKHRLKTVDGPYSIIEQDRLPYLGKKEDDHRLN